MKFLARTFSRTKPNQQQTSAPSTGLQSRRNGSPMQEASEITWLGATTPDVATSINTEQFLEKNKLSRMKVPSDGNCAYHALVVLLQQQEETFTGDYQDVRLLVANEIYALHQDEAIPGETIAKWITFDFNAPRAYSRRMFELFGMCLKDQEWASTDHFKFMSIAFDCTIVLFTAGHTRVQVFDSDITSSTQPVDLSEFVWQEGYYGMYFNGVNHFEPLQKWLPRRSKRQCR
eukprot:scaffold1444_cov164-Pinguiococcus_pyrenoidosus.AAC.1